jgi:hypothetical protein
MISTAQLDLKISTPTAHHPSRLSASTSGTYPDLQDQHVAAFKGTFAPDARPPFDPVHKPWYRDPN